MEISRARRAVFEALKIAAPHTFDDAMRHAFLAERLNLKLTELDMDSLGEMEFCISIELSTGVTVLPSQLAALGSTEAIELHLEQALA